MAAEIIVFANEKGGTGKSTVAMHLIISLLRAGKKVATFDLDARQGTLTRYIANRAEFVKKNGIPLPMPTHICWDDEKKKIYTIKGELEKLSEQVDYIVVDTPGSYTPETVEVISMAKTLVTPLNDSLLDLDVLASVDQETMKIKGPSHFSQTVWEARQQRMLGRKPPLNWVVLRNRLLYVKSKNSRTIMDLLTALSRRIHFLLAGGISERVIYRELFIKGLTMLDCKENGLNMPLSVSSVLARQEIRTLVNKILYGDLKEEKKGAITTSTETTI